MRMGRLGRWAVAAALGAGALVGGGAEALAQDWIPHSRRSAVGGDVYTWPTDDVFALAMVPFFNYEVAPHIFLDLDFPIGFADVDFGPFERSGFALGNPAFAIRYADTSGKLTWTAGGGAALPVASADDRGPGDFNSDWQVALAYSAASMGLWDAFLWAPDAIPTFGRFAFEVRAARPIYLRFFIDPIVLIPFDRRNDLEILGQGKFEFEARANSGPGGGVALQFVGDPTGERYIGDGDDDFDVQAAAEPFFSFDNNKLFLRVGGLIGLNRPLGPGFDRNRLFALHFNIGGHL